MVHEKRLQHLALRIGRRSRQAKNLYGEEGTNQWVVWGEVGSAWVLKPQGFNFSTHDLWKTRKDWGDEVVSDGLRKRLPTLSEL